MYSVRDSTNNVITSKYIEACGASSRRVSIKCTFNGTVTYDGNYLISIELSEMINTDTQNIVMGATPSNSIKIKMYMPSEKIPLEGGYLEPSAGIDIGNETVYLPLGMFYVTDVTTADNYKTVEITAYDKMSSLNDTYVPDNAKAPNTPYDTYTYTCAGTEVQGQPYFFTADSATYQFEMPAVSDGEMLVFDTFDAKLHINDLDGEEIALASGSVGTNLTEFFVKEAYRSAYVADVFDDIKTQASISSDADFSEYDYRIDVYKNTYTYKEMIGYIAGLTGKNAVFDRDNKLAFRWYETAKDENGSSVAITNDMEYMDGFERTTDGPVVIHSVTSGTEDKLFASGSGYGISFTNPFMTQKRLDMICAGISGMSVCPCTLKYRGIPATECGDILNEGRCITAEDGSRIIKIDNAIYVMAQTFVFGKGMNAAVTAFGGSEASGAVSKSPTQQLLQEMYTGLTESFRQAAERLVGVQGGYFEILYNEATGKPSGWRIMDTPALTDNSKVWTMNKNGLYFSTGGGYSANNVAIDLTGSINANFITAGYMNAERIAVENYGGVGQKELKNYVRFSDGNILLGEQGSEITLQIENDRIAFYNSNGDAIACFANDSFSIQNIRNVRIGDFSYLTRSNGNLTFTKIETQA